MNVMKKAIGVILLFVLVGAFTITEMVALYSIGFMWTEAFVAVILIYIIAIFVMHHSDLCDAAVEIDCLAVNVNELKRSKILWISVYTK